MLRAYVSAGFDPEKFWSLTPRLYMTLMHGARDRLQREREERTAQSWVTAALSRAEKMPRLDEVLDGKPPPDPRRLAAQFSALNKVLPKITMDGWRARKRG